MNCVNLRQHSNSYRNQFKHLHICLKMHLPTGKKHGRSLNLLNHFPEIQKKGENVAEGVGLLENPKVDFFCMPKIAKVFQ